MRAEIVYEGRREELALPDNTFFVNCQAAFENGCSVNVLNDAGLAVAEEALGCRAVPIGASGVPAGLTLHALVDPDGELAKTVRFAFAGLEIARAEYGDFRLSVTV
ncbi:MAG: hypothetical protein IK090_03840 [Clostridia bacterium]|nr:hypothetical protein [Clostridia bacterium]MBR4770044.1 hypothetical protein [Clostridia bacterium]